MDFLVKSKFQSLVGKRAIQAMSPMPSDSGLGASPTTGTTTRTLMPLVVSSLTGDASDVFDWILSLNHGEP